jgi:hypothetical protein
MDYALVEAGSRLWSKLSPNEQQGFLLKLKGQTNRPIGLDFKRATHIHALYGAATIGVTYHTIANLIEAHGRFSNFRADFQSRHGCDSLVRLKKDWLFDARDNRGLTYREFAVLCAIYSAIGNKDLAIITRNRIRRCALGYRSAAIMEADLPRRADGARPLSERELRDTIGRLHRNKFFARCTVARRITYYSIRLDSEALRKKVLERRTYPGFFRASQAAQDQALTVAIKNQHRESVQKAPGTPAPQPRFVFKPPGHAE